MATPEQIDQARRVVTLTRERISEILELTSGLRESRNSYQRLQLNDPLNIPDEAFVGTGTTFIAYQDVITAIDAVLVVLEGGHATTMERFAR